MTLPGMLQALLILVVAGSSFISYFSFPRHVLSSLVVGGLFAILGLVIISMNWNPPPSLSDVWNFRAADFYQGTFIFSVGVGIAVGNVVAWIVSKGRQILRKET